jgi:hypothetical protein
VSLHSFLTLSGWGLPVSKSLAALTNFKIPLIQICDRLERNEFALDVAVKIAGLQVAMVHALQGLPVKRPEAEAVAESGETAFFLTGKFIRFVQRYATDGALLYRVHLGC